MKPHRLLAAALVVAIVVFCVYCARALAGTDAYWGTGEDVALVAPRCFVALTEVRIVGKRIVEVTPMETPREVPCPRVRHKKDKRAA